MADRALVSDYQEWVKAKKAYKAADKVLRDKVYQYIESTGQPRPVSPANLGSFDLVIGDYWECPESPTGHCVYDRYEDPAHDNCIFCGDPEERK
jgi:hypothetical protein